MSIITSGPQTRPRGTRRRGPRRGAAAAPAGPALIVAEPGEKARALPIPLGWSRIGRSRTAEIRVRHPDVSRRHALIVRSREGRLQVIDDRSLTGIAVNGRSVSWAELTDGDELSLGGVRVEVRDSAGPLPKH